MKKISLEELGSNTAKNGFINEQDVVNAFNNWQNNNTAKQWLVAMSYNLQDIEDVKAVKVKGSYKADIQVQIHIIIKLKQLIDCQNIQVKLVSNKKGFNQIDKRWLKSYKELWDIPNNVYKLLQYYTGELKPYKKNVKDLQQRRMFINELSDEEQKIVLSFLNQNKTLIVSDILKGRGKFATEWMLVILKYNNNSSWVLKPINFVLNYYSAGSVEVSKKGNIHIGKITMQRKGGDAGRKTANMLQFKIDPSLLFIQQ